MRAWTSWHWDRPEPLLGSLAIWGIMRATGEAGGDAEDEEAPVEGGAVIGLARGQFLKGGGCCGGDERAVWHRWGRRAG